MTADISIFYMQAGVAMTKAWLLYAPWSQRRAKGFQLRPFSFPDHHYNINALFSLLLSLSLEAPVQYMYSIILFKSKIDSQS